MTKALVRNLIVSILFLFLVPMPCFAQWQKIDTAGEILFLSLHYIDYQQTKSAIANDGYKEANPLINNPNSFFLIIGILHPVITYIIPEGKYRRLWQGVSIGLKGSAVIYNYSIGVKF